MPAVAVVILNPPEGAAVEPVRPAPIVIVKVSGYLRRTVPEPPLPPMFALAPAPPPPLPVLTVPAVPVP